MSSLRWIGVLVLLLAGCDQMPWSSSKSTDGPTPLANASSPSAPLPSKPAVSPADVVANVNNSVISKRDVELAIQEMKANAAAFGQPWTALSAQEQPDKFDLPELLDLLILAELRTQDAIARGLDRDSGVQERFANRYRNFFAQEWVASQLERAAVTDEEIKQFYQANQLGFREPEQIRLRQLMVTSEDQAKAALVKLLEGLDFSTLAQQVSVQPEAAGNPLSQQWVMRSAEKAAFAPTNPQVRDLRDPALEQAAFAISTSGGLSSIVKGPDGHFHIFQLIERKEGRQRPFSEVSDNIRSFLQVQRLTKMTEELKTKAKIDRFPDRLAGIKQ